ncbi:MAG: glycine cleavage system protein GcvH [Phycisphaeraceae bacterium]
MSTAPDDRRYTESHEWHKPEGELVVIGLSEFAVEELTDITFVEIETTEGPISRGDTIGEVESVKATSEVYCGIDGEVVEANQAVLDDPSLLNQDPYGKGWLIKVRPSDTAQLDDLLSAADYERSAAG